MGAGAILQGLLNSATSARTGQLQGQQVANQRATQDAIQQIVQQRAMQQAQLADQLKQLQINNLVHPPTKASDFHYENRPDGTYRINSLNGEATKVGGVPGVEKPVQFVPGAVPGTRVDPNAPGGVSVLPGVTPAPKTASTPADINERQREQGWRQTYSKRVAELQQPQVDPTNPFLKQPGLSYEQAKARAYQEASDAWGQAPSGVAGPSVVVKPPAKKGQQQTGDVNLSPPTAAEWDALAQQFGAEAVTKKFGARPSGG